MKLGLSLGYWGLGLTAADQIALARAAEAEGFDSVWVAEAYGSDAVSVLGRLSGETSRIRLGSAIMQMPARSAAATAMTAATLDGLSGGRFVLGLGPSGPQVSENWHGVPFARQLRRTREYVEVVRLALSGDHVRYAGDSLRLAAEPGDRPLKLTIRPVQEHVPIYLTGLGPKSVALAGEIADGWFPLLFSPAHVSVFEPHLAAGAARSGRTAADVAVAPLVNVVITDDVDAGRDVLRPFLALYVGGMGSREQNFYTRLMCDYGFEANALEVQELYLSGHRSEAAAALSPKLIDAVSVVGPLGAARERLAQFRAAGVDTLICASVGELPLERRCEQLRLLAHAVG